jgi:hypothetical protein
LSAADADLHGMVNRAVVVGINDYPGTGSDLAGCVNDALDWDAALRARGYSTVVLLNEAATKGNVVAALKAAVAASKRYDRLTFTFSGHGTYVPDRDGDEADHRDEALVCHDVRSGGLLVDDQLQQILGQTVEGVRQVILSDSCHSGSVSRFVGATPLDARPRFLPPAVFMEGKQLAAAKRVEQVQVTSRSREGAVLISGCTDQQYSYDVGGPRPHGAFTRAALATLGTAKTYAGWHAAIRKLLPSEDAPQSPQLTATPTQRYWKPLG